MEELKPCPFCGGKAEITHYLTSMEHEKFLIGSYEMQCRDCHIPTVRYTVSVSLNDTGEIEMDYNGKTRAIKAWNTRTHEKENDNG